MADDREIFINEVRINGETVLTTRGDTVAEDNLLSEETATNRAGRKIKGNVNGDDLDLAYLISDPVDDITEGDYIPFHDVSDNSWEKKKILFAKIIDKMRKYFLEKTEKNGNYKLEQGATTLNMVMNNIDASMPNNNVTGNTYPSVSNILDREKRIIMRTEASVLPNGNIGWKCYVRNYDTDGNRVAQKGIFFEMDKSGNLTYTVNDARAFRKAINTVEQLGTLLASGTVIDDYHADIYVDNYYIPSDVIAQSLVTLPEALCGKLIVSNNGNGGYSQYYIPNHSVKIYVRVWWDNSWSAWKDISNGSGTIAWQDNVHYLSQPDTAHQITNNEDLDDYTTAGTYQCNNGSIAITLVHCPVSTSFKLVVDRAYTRVGSEITQRITCQNLKGSTDWYRTKNYGAEATWGDWKHLASTDDVGANGYAEGTINGSAISATITGFVLKTGAIVSVHIPSEITTACTLNINSTGAKNVTFWDTLSPTFGCPLIGGAIYTFMYDGTRYRVISRDRTPSVGVQNYEEDVSGNILLDWGYKTNRTQIKYNIQDNKLRWNYRKNSAWRGDVNIADYNDIVHQTLGTDIPANSDLNDYKTNGIYTVALNASAETISNLPVARAGKLVVMRVAGNQYVKQIYITYDSVTSLGDGVYQRTYNGDSSAQVWRDWIGYGDIDVGSCIATTGKNLIPTWRSITSTRTSNGITFTFNPSDGSISANGTATGVATCILWSNADSYYLPKGNYFLSGCPSGGNGTYSLRLQIKEKNRVEVSYVDTGDGVRISLEEDAHNTTTSNYYIRIDSGTTVNNIVFYPMIRPLATTEDYEPNENIYKGNCYVGICETAANQKDKVAYVDGYFVLRTGVRVAIKFTNSNTYSNTTDSPITLNVNNTGAKNIWYNTTHSGSGNTGTNTTIYGVANRYHYYVYDGTYWVWDSQSNDNNNIYGLVSNTANGLAPMHPVNSKHRALRADNTWDETPYTHLSGDYSASSAGWFAVSSNHTDNSGTMLNAMELKCYVNNGRLTYNFYRDGAWKGDGAVFNKWFPNIVYCTSATAAGTAAKVASTQGGGTLIGLTAGMMACVVHSNSNTASNCTLNIDGTGAKSIYYDQGVYTGSSTLICGRQNMAIFYMYDGTYWRWIGIGRNDAAASYLPLTGGTVTGSIVLKRNDIDAQQSDNGVSSTAYPTTFCITDKNSLTLARLEAVIEPSGTIQSVWYIRNYLGSTTQVASKSIKMKMDKTGDLTYELSDAKNFAAALGIGYAVCNTAAATTAKEATMGKYALSTNGYVSVQFVNSVPASATLSINSKDTKPIYYRGSAITANVIQGGDLATFIYYDNKYHLVSIDRSTSSGGSGNVYIGTCSTAADQQIKAVTCANFTLTVGATINVKFSNTNTFSSQTATPIQLNVNNTGAKNIWYNNTHSGAGNTGTNARIYGEANKTFTFMYDGTYWVWLNCGYEADTVDPRSLSFGYGTCDTAAATTAKVVTLASYNLRNGGYVSVKFTNSVPANATMNINSKGAKNIWYRGANITANIILAGDIATFVYDGTRYQLVGIDRAISGSSSEITINYTYEDAAGTPDYLVNIHSNLKVTNFYYVVCGKVVTVNMLLTFTSASTYSQQTSLMQGLKHPCGLAFFQSNNKQFFVDETGTVWFRKNQSVTSGETLWCNVTYITSE